MVILPELPKETAPAHKESSHHQDQEPASLNPIWGLISALFLVRPTNLAQTHVLAQTTRKSSEMPALIFAEVILPETTMETAPAQKESSHHQDQEPAMLSPNYARTTRKSLEENALMYAMVILPELPKETAPAHKE